MKQVTSTLLTVFLILVIISGNSTSTFADIASETTTKAEQHFEKANVLLNRKEYKAAIAEFKDVMNISPNSKIAQDAQYWIGQSHFMTGQFDAAQATFAKLIEKYPDSAIVPLTKLMIDRVGQEKDIEEKRRAIAEAPIRFVSMEGGNGKAEVTLRRVLPDPKTFATRISPDGRYIDLGMMWGPNLIIRDLTTGEDRKLTNDGNWGRPHPDRGQKGSTWSPDSKQIAYAWRDEDRWELRIIGLDDSEPRVLYKNEELMDINPSDWSQDGKVIVGGLNRPDGTREIVLFSVADGSVRTLKSFKDEWEFHLNWWIRFSLDGRYIVYDRPVEENNGFRGIFLLPTDNNGKEIPLVRNPEGDSGFPVWAPDGKTIIFERRDPLGNASLWLTQAVDGKRVGEPRFVMRGRYRIIPIQFTREGSLLYRIFHPPRRSSIHIASLDMETGELLSQPTRLRSEGSNSEPSWSPDGKKLAYQSTRLSLDGTSLKDVIVIRSIETGEEHEFLRPKLLGDSYCHFLSWSPDGRYLLCGGVYFQGIHLLDVRTGKVTTVVDSHPKEWLFCPRFSPDGRMIFYLRVLTERGKWPCSIVAHEVATGQEQELYPRANRWSKLAVSPDGLELAFQDVETIKVIPIAGGPAREIYRGGELFTWARNGRYLLFTKDKSNPPEVWRIPTKGGDAEKLWELKNPIKNEWNWTSRLHPDGRRIAYTKRSGNDIKPELWIMDNLLTTFATEK